MRGTLRSAAGIAVSTVPTIARQHRMRTHFGSWVPADNARLLIACCCDCAITLAVRTRPAHNAHIINDTNAHNAVCALVARRGGQHSSAADDHAVARRTHQRMQSGQSNRTRSSLATSAISLCPACVTIQRWIADQT